MIKCFFVDVVNISSDVPRSSFAKSDLDQLADLILQTDGLLRPLILSETGVEKYTVVEGHREYYAVVTAKEKDMKKAEMVNAFVLPTQIHSSAIEQLNLLKSDLSPTPPSPSNLVNIEQLLPTLLAAISGQIQPIVDQLTEHKQILDVLISTPSQVESKQPVIPQPQPEPIPVNIPAPEPPIIEKIEPPDPISLTTDNALNLINTLSESDLSTRMQRSGIAKAITKLVPKIIEIRTKQPEEKFDTWKTIIAAKIGLGDGRIKEITEKLR